MKLSLRDFLTKKDNKVYSDEEGCVSNIYLLANQSVVQKNGYISFQSLDVIPALHVVFKGSLK